MTSLKKKGVFFLVILILGTLLINFVSSQTIIQTQQPEPEQKAGFFSTLLGVISSPLFIGIVVVGLVIVGLTFLLAWVIIKIIKYIKLRTDLFYKLKIERVKMAKNQSRYTNVKHWFKIDKNVPIRMIKIDENNVPIITNPVAYYRGDYISHEGNLMIAINLPYRKRFWIFPITDILVIPNKEDVETTEQEEKNGKKSEVTKLVKIPVAKDLVKFLDREILIYGESITMSGTFFMPVVKDKDGKVLNLSIPIYKAFKEVVAEDLLYTQTSQFVDLTRKAVDMNPNLRYATKLGDQNQAVELPDRRAMQ